MMGLSRDEFNQLFVPGQDDNTASGIWVNSVVVRDTYVLSLHARFVQSQLQSLAALPQHSNVLDRTKLLMFSNWTDAGLPVFKVPDPLVTKLCASDDASNTVDIKFPHKTFVVEIPPGWWIIDGEDVRWVLFSSDIPVLNLDTGFVRNNGMGLSLISSTRTLQWSDPKAINKTIRQLVNEDIPTYETGDAIALDEAETRQVRQALTLVFNLASYIAEFGNTGTRVGRRKKSGNFVIPDSSPQPDVWLYGHGVKCAPEMIQAVKDWARSDSEERATVWKISKRFIVRGHWRNQACGEGRTDRRRTWIQPHWKGIGPKMQHIYEVQEVAEDVA